MIGGIFAIILIILIAIICYIIYIKCYKFKKTRIPSVQKNNPIIVETVSSEKISDDENINVNERSTNSTFIKETKEIDTPFIIKQTEYNEIIPTLGIFFFDFNSNILNNIANSYAEVRQTEECSFSQNTDYGIFTTRNG
jgi:uncharacterized protein YxeA